MCGVAVLMQGVMRCGNVEMWCVEMACVVWRCRCDSWCGKKVIYGATLRVAALDYGVAMMGRLPQISSLFDKRALQK